MLTLLHDARGELIGGMVNYSYNVTYEYTTIRPVFSTTLVYVPVRAVYSGTASFVVLFYEWSRTFLEGLANALRPFMLEQPGYVEEFPPIEVQMSFPGGAVRGKIQAVTLRFSVGDIFVMEDVSFGGSRVI